MRHAEIAGAGIGGLTIAAALAQRGWRVRVHERAAELRDIGIGTTIWANGHRVLAEIGALDDMLAAGTRISRIEVRDHQQQELRVDTFSDGANQGTVVLRVDLHQALVNAARRAGVEIVLNSLISGADPVGALLAPDGTAYPADLVIGADGYHSKVRDSLGLATHVGSVTDAMIGRALVPRGAPAPIGTIREYWGPTRCCGVLTCGDVDYMFLSGPENCPFSNEEVRTASLAKGAWTDEFPFLAERFATTDHVIWGRYPIVRCSTWSSGHAAILGDAAHSMPSTLAQGAGCAMANAFSLANFVTGTTDIPAALNAWETRERPVTDTTQRWAVLYLTMLKRWPDGLLDMRTELAKQAFMSPGILAEFTAAARHKVNEALLCRVGDAPSAR
jgi:2-polyprenyl-6-methoxyphenol hydroxylase-like FAD-dependent oxidoreductase